MSLRLPEHYPKIRSSRALKLGNFKNKELIEAMSEMYEKYGSIRRCQDIYDFGRYRFCLLAIMDSTITKIKRGKNGRRKNKTNKSQYSDSDSQF